MTVVTGRSRYAETQLRLNIRRFVSTALRRRRRRRFCARLSATSSGSPPERARRQRGVGPGGSRQRQLVQRVFQLAQSVLQDIVLLAQEAEW